MNKSARYVSIVLAFAPLLTSSVYGGGGCRSQRSIRGGGGYPSVRGVIYSTPGFIGQPPPQIINPIYTPPNANCRIGVGPTAPPATGPLGLPDGSFTVYVVDPLTGREFEYKKVYRRTQADELRNNLQRRYWIIYSHNGTEAVHEVRDAASIDAEADKLRASGYRIKAYQRVVARVHDRDDDEISLGALVGHPPKDARPIEPPSLSDKEEPKGNGDFNAIAGAWKAVARSADGQLRSLDLKLDSGGWANISVPTEDGESTEVSRQAVLEDRTLKFTDGENDIVLGELIKVTTNEFVVQRDEGQITFVRQQLPRL